MLKKLIKWGLLAAVVLLLMFDGLTYVFAYLDLDDVSRSAVHQAGTAATAGRNAKDSYEAALVVTEPNGVTITAFEQEGEKVTLWTSKDLEGTIALGYVIRAVQSQPTATIDQRHGYAAPGSDQ